MIEEGKHDTKQSGQVGLLRFGRPVIIPAEFRTLRPGLFSKRAPDAAGELVKESCPFGHKIRL